MESTLPKINPKMDNYFETASKLNKALECLTNLVNAHANNDPASTQKYMADAYKIVRGEVKTVNQ